MSEVWELTLDAGGAVEVNVDAAWSQLGQRIAEAEGRGRVRPIWGGRPLLKWIAAAAVVSGLVFAAQWFFQPKAEHYMAGVEATEVLLADNSRSVLSAGSTLDVRMDDERNVTLNGAAYFEVQRDEQRPFIVTSGEVLVTVLGTAFEVSAYDTSGSVSVRVRSGRVEVKAGEVALVLTAGQHAVYHKERHFLERKSAPPAEVWGLRILQFEGATLQQVADQLQRIYKVPIALQNPSIARCTLTAEFDDETLATILGVIADTFGLEVKEENGTYKLDGDGC